jgi:hypothetical protein
MSGGRVGTASRHRGIAVGLSALAQPRLTKGGQPYLGTGGCDVIASLPLANARSLYRLDQQDGGPGLLAKRDGVALHQLGTGKDFFAAVEVFDLVALLRDEAS